MSWRLVGQDCSVVITDGGAVDGTVNWSTSTNNVKALAKSVKINETLSTHDMTTLGDTRKKKRPQVGESRIEIELAVASTGAVTSVTLGNYTRVQFDAAGTTNYTSWAGILIENSLDTPDGSDTQRLVIDCDAETA